MEWRTIETVNKQIREPIWVWRPDMEIANAAFSDTFWVATPRNLMPTHWMPRAPDDYDNRPPPPRSADHA